MGKRKKNINGKKPKLEIVFDEKKRVEFLTGFRKRKNDRRKKAKAEIEEMVKLERKRIRQEVKDKVNVFKKSYAPLPAEDDIFSKEEEYDEGKVTVKVVELLPKDLAMHMNGLGENTNYETNEHSSDSEIDNVETNEISIIPGMPLTTKEAKNQLIKTETKEISSKQDSFITKKKLDHMKQKSTLKSMKKSKVFKMKNRLNQLENKKLAKRMRNTQKQQLKKQGRPVKKKPNFQPANNSKVKHKRRK